MTARWENETVTKAEIAGACLTHAPGMMEGTEDMRQRNGDRRQQRIFQAVALGAAWVCIALCLIQLAQVRGQLREQRELISRTCNMVQMYHADVTGGQDSGSEWQISHGAADAVTVGTLSISYAERCALDHVDSPQERNSRQVLERLEELGQWDERIAAISQNSGAYPERLLEALANNPEMADFAKGWLTAEHRAAGGLTESEKEEEFPLFLQWDPRWGYAPYGDDSCIAVSGCGPTCLSMALYYLTGDESLTPDVIAAYSMEKGYYLSGTGTLWALMEDVAPRYGVGVSQPSATEWGMKAALDDGKVLILSMRPGDFTAGGHFIVIYGYDQDGFLVNDPNCVARSRMRWTYDQICRQIKQLWVFEKESC